MVIVDSVTSFNRNPSQWMVQSLAIDLESPCNAQATPTSVDYTSHSLMYHTISHRYTVDSHCEDALESYNLIQYNHVISNNQIIETYMLCTQFK